MNNAEQWITTELEQLQAHDLRRRLSTLPASGGKFTANGRVTLNFSSNDYLDLARHPTLLEAAIQAARQYGGGAASSRLLTGTLPPHAELEGALAAFKGYPAALVFGSGYQANVGLLSALVGRDDTIFADRLAHASIVDGSVLSRARLQRFRHNHTGHLRQLLQAAPPRGRRLVVTESVFSMDGDVAPLAELAALAAEFEALLVVDEAHATGVFGPAGSGLIRAQRLEGAVHVSMGTCSKSMGGSGGFVACSVALRDWLINRARSFIYSTAPPPFVVAAACAAVRLMEEHPGWGAELLCNAAAFRARLRAAGLDTLRSESQIVPLRVGPNDLALRLAASLREVGILVHAIRPPTVPEGTARLRFSVTRAHTPEDLECAAAAVVAAARGLGLP